MSADEPPVKGYDEMKAYWCTVHLLIRADTQVEACDAVSALLTENGVYGDEPTLFDWAYIRQGDDFDEPKKVEVPDDLDEGDFLPAVVDHHFDGTEGQSS